MEFLNLFIAAFVVMFVVVDPVGVTGVFSALSAKIPADQSRKIAVRAALIAISILVFFAFVGTWLLQALHISMPAFRISGGMLLFVTAFRMIMGYHDPDQVDSEAGSYKDRSSIAVFPLAIPLMAGPGTITAIMLLTSEYTGLLGKAMVLSAMISVEIIALLFMLSAAHFTKVIGSTGNSLIARVMGVLLAGMAVQFVADGAFALVDGHFN
ncbi:MAG: MarC family protein [Micavibrio sp.]|nr:MarC family protein [Micavibrio sp.]